MRRRQRNAVNALVYEIVDDVDLSREIDLRRGPVPADFDSQLAPGRDRARMHGLPEDVRLRFGDNRNDRLALFLAGHTRQQADQKRDAQYFLHPHPRMSHERKRFFLYHNRRDAAERIHPHMRSLRLRVLAVKPAHNPPRRREDAKNQ